jgi:hypothetical protein
MSEATERPASDSDAWAKACAEDLAAERARRRAQYGVPPGSAAEELRKLIDAVADKVSTLPAPLAGMAAQGAFQQLVHRARAAVDPVIERNPDVLDHLAAAGGELLAAYRSAVESQERRWSQSGDEGRGRPEDGEGPGGPGSERIDLD